jgi:autotransporter translocation and assembly factor TamB
MKITALTLILSLISSPLFSSETSIIVNGKTTTTTGEAVISNNGTITINGRTLAGNIIQGSGKFSTETRNLPNFTEVHLGIAADVTIISGEKPNCQILADDNLHPLISTESSGLSLRISAKDNYSSARKIAIKLETPLLTRTENNGSGRISIAEVNQEKIELVINGSGDITVNGEVSELNTEINGSGSVHAENLQADIVKININGSGNADVNSIDALTAKINGSGNIHYIGKPPKMNTRVTGSGTISNK